MSAGETAANGRIKVLHLLRTLGIGGTERRILRLGQGLDPQQFDVHVMSFFRAEGQSLPWPEERRHAFTMPPGLHWGRMRALAAFIRDQGFHVVHSHNWATMFHGVLAGRMAGVPLVLHGEHGRNEQDRLGIPWKRECAAALLARTATRVVAVNEAIAADIGQRWRLGAERITCIPNGVDIERFAPPQAAAEPEFLIGTVARFDNIKNLPCLVRAFAGLRRARPQAPVRLVLVGTGPQEAELQALAVQCGVADRVSFPGETATPEQWYRRFAVYANTSFSEGMSNSILEAMSCGVPIVASDIAGHRCWLTEGEHALFFRSDDEAALTACLQRLLDAPELRRQLGETNRRHVEAEFDNRLFLTRYAQLYRNLLRREH
ncbi:MAG: hypothetical protein DI603_16660 [Roseateles depolymerans]|uniref:Glycosyltransferase subfamily 4-like N-terminal domain-containing protein n=1 Tax=Roseateles depolymerans TaxID=76731 RepID=A0A2W5FFI7_9BURK|nr:MAG: hypothetical protein DI603_16660 [Roseateles depolymerans]